MNPTKSVLPNPHHIDKEKLRKEIMAILEDLSPREQQIITLRFGLDDSITRTLEEVGKHFGLTRERIRQIEATALARIRHYQQETL